MGTALVTGASAGIGRALAIEIADRGHDVVLVARDRARLGVLASEISSQFGVQTSVLAADLSDREQLQLVADRLSDPEHPIDLLVNNAGFGVNQSFSRGDIASEELALDVMVRAVMVLSRSAVTGMVDRGHGAILNVSSIASLTVMGHYSAIKSWVTVFSEGLAAELAGTGVTVTALLPGFVHTEFHERASMNMSRLPDSWWLDAHRVAQDTLEDVSAGKVISIPSTRYKGLAAVLTTLPRSLTRKVATELAMRRRTS